MLADGIACVTRLTSTSIRASPDAAPCLCPCGVRSSRPTQHHGPSHVRGARHASSPTVYDCGYLTCHALGFRANTVRALTSVVSPLLSQGPSNTIKAEQILFQAQKKASGNTHTARGMPLNIFAFCAILGGGSVLMLTTLRKLYYGVGKIVLKDE